MCEHVGCQIGLGSERHVAAGGRACKGPRPVGVGRHMVFEVPALRKCFAAAIVIAAKTSVVVVYAHMDNVG